MIRSDEKSENVSLEDGVKWVSIRNWTAGRDAVVLLLWGIP
jgi:hypothetical protein